MRRLALLIAISLSVESAIAQPSTPGLGPIEPPIPGNPGGGLGLPGEGGGSSTSWEPPLGEFGRDFHALTNQAVNQTENMWEALGVGNGSQFHHHWIRPGATSYTSEPDEDVDNEILAGTTKVPVVRKGTTQAFKDMVESSTHAEMDVKNLDAARVVARAALFQIDRNLGDAFTSVAIDTRLEGADRRQSERDLREQLAESGEGGEAMREAHQRCVAENSDQGWGAGAAACLGEEFDEGISLGGGFDLTGAVPSFLENFPFGGSSNQDACSVDGIGGAGDKPGILLSSYLFPRDGASAAVQEERDKRRESWKDYIGDVCIAQVESESSGNKVFEVYTARIPPRIPPTTSYPRTLVSTYQALLNLMYRRCMHSAQGSSGSGFGGVSYTPFAEGFMGSSFWRSIPRAELAPIELSGYQFPPSSIVEVAYRLFISKEFGRLSPRVCQERFLGPNTDLEALTFTDDGQKKWRNETRAAGYLASLIATGHMLGGFTRAEQYTKEAISSQPDHPFARLALQLVADTAKTSEPSRAYIENIRLIAQFALKMSAVAAAETGRKGGTVAEAVTSGVDTSSTVSGANANQH